ncbi:MAG: aspartyl protease family protein [Hyphomonadaceae bacterium]
MRWLISAALACALFLAAGAAPARERGEAIVLYPYAGQLKTIEVSIGGRPARLLFDTGAGVTALTPQFAAQIGCAPVGVITAFRMDGERVRFQRCPAPVHIEAGGLDVSADVAVFDLLSLLPPDLPPLDGVAGLDIFRGRAITLQADLSAIVVETPASLRRRTRGRAPARIRLSQEGGGAGVTAFAPAPSRIGDLWLLLDSGNLAGLRLHPSAAEALGGPGPVTLAVEGAAPFEATPEIVDDLIYDGVLDASFMRGYAITLDLGRARAWWTPAN